MRLGAQALSNMLYGFAVLSFNPGPLFFSVVARGVRWQLQDFSPQVSPLSCRVIVEMSCQHGCMLLPLSPQPTCVALLQPCWTAVAAARPA